MTHIRNRCAWFRDKAAKEGHHQHRKMMNKLAFEAYLPLYQPRVVVCELVSLPDVYYKCLVFTDIPSVHEVFTCVPAGIR